MPRLWNHRRDPVSTLGSKVGSDHLAPPGRISSTVATAARAAWRNLDAVYGHTDIPEARWYQIDADDKKRARLNCIRHILSMIPYQDIIPRKLELPPRPHEDKNYVRPPREKHLIVADYYVEY